MFLVKSKIDGNLYALKRMNLYDFEYNNDWEHLKNEIKLHQKLKSPFIIRQYGYFYDTKHIYILMEYADGGSLQDYIDRKGSLSESESIDLAAQLLLSIKYLHKRKIAHRDIKPDNIMFGSDGRLKLIDFGLAKKLSKPTNSFCGTISYMSPEIVCGDQYSFDADIWAYGIVVYEMLTGDLPFHGRGDEEVFRKILQGQISFPENISEAAKRFINRILNLQNRVTNISVLKYDSWFFSLIGKNLEYLNK